MAEEKQNTDRRFRWSASCQPGEGLVARGGVEPPTFRFSVLRSSSGMVRHGPGERP